jgi:hypothetical protein
MVLVAVGKIDGIRSGKFIPVNLHSRKIIIKLFEMQAEQTRVRQQGRLPGFK